jgi:hypothetical protein
MIDEISNIGNNANQKSFGNFSPNIIGNNNNIFSQINIGDNTLVRQVQEYYSHIYYWHKKNGLRIYRAEINQVEEYTSYTNILSDAEVFVAPHITKPEEMINIANEIIEGCMQWSAVYYSLSEPFTLIHYARKIKNTANIKVLESKEDFYEFAQKELLKQDFDLNYIHKHNLETTKNLGGLVATMQTNKQFSDKVIANPTVLGFKKIANEKSLVKAIKKNLVKIYDIILFTDDDGDYKVEFDLENLTNQNIELVIPKGQIFENKYVDKNEIKPTQNLAIRENEEINLKSKQRKKCKINAWCLNGDFKPPKPKEDYILGNITIFEVENKAFETNNDLWINMKNQNEVLRNLK